MAFRGRGFGRRTVLQLQDKPKGLPGLIASYGDSDEEEEHFEENNGKPETTTSSQASSRGSTPSLPESKPATETNDGHDQGNPEIDNKLADFLAEINAMETPEEATPSSNAETLSDSQANKEEEKESSESSESEEENKEEEEVITAPAAPSTVWQHCLDEGTQCFYYWNTASNEVTWEIPPQYSQYMLQQKEYEEQLLYYQKKLEEREERIKQRLEMQEKRRKEKEARRQQRKLEKANKAVAPQSSISDPVAGPELPKHLVLSNPSSPKHVQSDVGPILPSQRLPSDRLPSDNTQYGPQLPQRELGIPKSHSEPELATRYEDMASSRPMSTLKKGYISFVAASKNLEPLQDLVTGNVISEAHDRDKVTTIQTTVTLPTQEPVTYGPQLPPHLVTRESEPALTTSGKQDSIESSQPIMDEERNEADDSDIDMDDIDMQLELALERKEPVEKNLKRKAEDPDSTSTKKSKIPSPPVPAGNLNNGSVKLPTADRGIPHTKKLDKSAVKVKAEVADLTSLILDKLEFLEVTRKGLSKLQILLIEMETRLSDWREGGLGAEHMLSKLHEAEGQLEQYESSAAPPGWSCHWDRSFRRYFYFNPTSGDTQWDYPEEAIGMHRPVPPAHPPHSAVRKPPHILRPRFHDKEIEDEDAVSSSVEYHKPSYMEPPVPAVSTTAYSRDVKIPDPISLAVAPPPPPPPFMNGINPNAPPPPPPPEIIQPQPIGPGLHIRPSQLVHTGPQLSLPPPPPPPGSPPHPAEPTDDVVMDNEGCHVEESVSYNYPPGYVENAQDSQAEKMVISAAPVLAPSAPTTTSSAPENVSLTASPPSAIILKSARSTHQHQCHVSLIHHQTQEEREKADLR